MVDIGSLFWSFTQAIIVSDFVDFINTGIGMHYAITNTHLASSYGYTSNVISSLYGMTLLNSNYFLRRCPYFSTNTNY